MFLPFSEAILLLDVWGMLSNCMQNYRQTNVPCSNIGNSKA